MPRRSLEIDSRSLSLARIAGAIWLIVEWLIMMACMLITYAAVFVENDENPDEDPMRFLDWIDAGAFTVWSVILLVAPLATSIGLFMNLRGDLGGWVRKLCFAVVFGNLLGAIWWWASLSDGSTPGTDVFVSVGMLFTAAVAAAMAFSAPKVAQPATS